MTTTLNNTYLVKVSTQGGGRGSKWPKILSTWFVHAPIIHIVQPFFIVIMAKLYIKSYLMWESISIGNKPYIIISDKLPFCKAERSLNIQHLLKNIKGRQLQRPRIFRLYPKFVVVLFQYWLFAIFSNSEIPNFRKLRGKGVFLNLTSPQYSAFASCINTCLILCFFT